MKALKTGNHQRYLENPALETDESGVADGNNIPGHTLGSKDVSRQLASQASAETGDGNALGGLLESFLGGGKGGDKGGVVDDLIGAAGKLFR